MSTITDVKQIPLFTEHKDAYEALVKQAQSQKVDVSLVDAALLQAVNNGKTLEQALTLVQSNVPKLPAPDLSLKLQLANWSALPAPGAVIMALITEVSAEQRQQNRELAWEQTEAVVQSMKDQAEKMRSMARTQFGLALTSATLTVVSGLVQSAISLAGVSSCSTTNEAQTIGALASGVGAGISGVGKMMDAGSQYEGSMYQAKAKEMEADQERMRAMRDSLKDLNDGLKDLIQKSLASAESIQQGRNQATTRILA